jgi:hypothetical protein
MYHDVDYDWLFWMMRQKSLYIIMYDKQNIYRKKIKQTGLSDKIHERTIYANNITMLSNQWSKCFHWTHKILCKMNKLYRAEIMFNWVLNFACLNKNKKKQRI